MNNHDEGLEALAREFEGRPRLYGSLLLLAVLAAVAAGVAWAFLAQVDDVTRATGRVVPASDVQRVTAPDEGLIREVHVDVGEIVAAGAPLMELDALLQSSQLNRELQRYHALRARIARLSAEIEERPLTFPPDLAAAAPEIEAGERALFIARSQELASQIAVLERQLEQRQREAAQIRSERDVAERLAALLEEQRVIIAPLVETGIEPRLTLLDVQGRQEEQAGRVTGSGSALLRAELGVLEVRQNIVATRDRFRAEALRDLTEANAELAALRPALPALESLAARATLRAPVRGVVNALHRRTLGSSVRAGEELVEIVPLDEDLRVEAYLRPQDIAFLRVGQPVRVKLTAYDFTRYGALEGSIIRIGANAVRLDANAPEEVFIAEIRTEGAILDAEGAQVQIIPGMTVEVDILAGKRRVVDYLLQPLQRLRDRAFEE